MGVVSEEDEDEEEVVVEVVVEEEVVKASLVGLGVVVGYDHEDGELLWAV